VKQVTKSEEKKGVSPGHWTLAKLYQRFPKELAENSQLRKAAEKFGKEIVQCPGLTTIPFAPST